MSDWLFSGGMAWFSVPAIIGTVYFVLRLGLMLVGGVADADMMPDVDADVIPDIDADVDLDPDADASTDAFKLLSLQVIATFLMGFGWGAFATIRSGLSDSVTIAVVIGVAIGLGLVWLLGLMMKAMYDLQTSGNISIGKAVGLEGEVYARVPARGDGFGQVRLVIDDHQRIFNARTEGEEIARSSRVKVTGVSGNMLVVAGP